MSIKNENDKSSAEKFAVLLKDKKKYFILAGVVAIILLAGVGVVEYFQRQKEDASVVLSEEIQKAFSSYIGAAEDDKASAEESLTALIAEAKSDFPGMYAELRALNTEALVYSSKEEYTEAAAAYTAIADQFSDSYIAAVSLINASAMMEEAGDNSAAVSLLERVLSEYKEISADIPEVLFNLGRLSESSDSEKAMAYYEQVSSEYSSSSWTNLAKSRIIALKAGS